MFFFFFCNGSFQPYQDRKVKVIVEQTFRGKQRAKPLNIYGTSYKADYQLVPKDQEFKYLAPVKTKDAPILPRHMEFPPLLRQFIVKETGNPNPLVAVKLHKTQTATARIAEEGEQPNIEIGMGFGKPLCANMYKGLDV